MTATLEDAEVDLQAALEACAEEPVHIPGLVQPIGALIAFSPEDGRVAYASETAAETFGRGIDEIFAAHASDLLGKEIWHNVRNAAAFPDFAEKRVEIGHTILGDVAHDVHAFGSQGLAVAEVEPRRRPEPGPGAL
ncbi:MAG: hypothetical protein AAGF90_21530, partial [Pseudomonadota bacterium]